MGVPDLDSPVVRRRREPGRVVRKGDGADPIAMPLERRQALAATVASETGFTSNAAATQFYPPVPVSESLGAPPYVSG